MAEAGAPACVVTPQQMEGPYFIDKQLNRSDIRSDPADGSVREGAPLALVLRVMTVESKGCAPLAGAVVDLWHCDALGAYSDVRDGGSDTTGRKFLRGYQVTDAGGQARFTTIYPGWYPGRAVHIHFKVRINAGARLGDEFTSQLYFDEAISERVFARRPYTARGARAVRNERDGLFRSGGSRLMLQLAESGEGYTANFDIGVAAATRA